MADKDLQALLDAANATIEKLKAEAEDHLKEIADKTAALATATAENLTLRDAASKAQQANNAGTKAPAGPPVLMTPNGTTDISVNVGGIKKYAAEAGEFIKVELEHVTDLLAHGFRHATPAEVTAAKKK